MVEDSAQSQVLIVDDSRVIRRAATKILDKDFDVIETEDGEEAWDEIQNNRQIAVVFTDLGMPNMDGYELLKTIRGSDDPSIANLPVIVITGAEESEGAREEVLELGATDFISKPFDSASLKSRATAHINYRTEVQSLEQRVATDKLTGLVTATGFTQQGEHALAYAIRHCDDLTLVRFDLDKFAELFVKLGKDAAEQILVKVASIIKEGLRKEDIAARPGVSRFALLLPSADYEGACLVVGRICQRIAKLKLKIGQEVLSISFSTGITSPELNNELTFEQLVEQAESALKQAAQAGGGNIVRYQSEPAASTSTEIAHVEVNLEELVAQLAQDSTKATSEELVSAMKKILPIISHADERLKLGMAKVVQHLKKRLKI